MRWLCGPPPPEAGGSAATSGSAALRGSGGGEPSICAGGRCSTVRRAGSWRRGAGVQAHSSQLLRLNRLPIRGCGVALLACLANPAVKALTSAALTDVLS